MTGPNLDFRAIVMNEGDFFFLTKTKTSPELVSEEDICTRGGNEDKAGQLDPGRTHARRCSRQVAATAQRVGQAQPRVSGGR